MRKVINMFALLFILSSSIYAQSVSNEEAINQMAKELSDDLTRKQKKLVVVADFVDLSGRVTPLGKSIRISLTTKLIKSSGTFSVIPTENLNDTIQQEKINPSEITKSDQRKKISKILGVDSIITGVISDIGLKNEVSANILDLEIGAYIGGSSIVLSKNSSIGQIDLKIDELNSNRNDSSKIEPYIVKDITKISKPEKKENKKTEGSNVKVAKNFSFKLQSCSLSGQTISCYLSITNSSKSSEKIWIYSNSQIFDENGQIYSSSNVEIGGTETTELSIPGSNSASVSVKIEFENIKSSTTKINLLQISSASLVKQAPIIRGAINNKIVPFAIEFKNLNLTIE